jgi:S1-C subfamily serine protease
MIRRFNLIIFVRILTILLATVGALTLWDLMLHFKGGGYLSEKGNWIFSDGSVLSSSLNGKEICLRDCDSGDGLARPRWPSLRPFFPGSILPENFLLKMFRSRRTILFPTQDRRLAWASGKGTFSVQEPPTALLPHLDPQTGYYDPLGPAEHTLDELVSIAVYLNVNRSVVNINTRGVQGERFLFWEIPAEGEGSGAVLDKKGHILTNFHVVDGARDIQVTLFDGTTYEAQPVGGDAATDVAVIRISAPPEKLYPVIFGDSSRLRVGQRVFAIGNPFGLERTMTTGIISSLNRELPSQKQYRKITQVIQIDAAINPGNSGGPLLDVHSRMIGMNTAIASRTGESAGVGFAIPVNTVAKVVPQLIERGRVIRPDIGIARVYQTEAGLLISALVPGGAAERAGLRGPKIIRRQRRQGPFVYEVQTIDRTAADLIVGVDGKPTLTVEDFLNEIESREPGQRVMINIIREGKEMSIPVILDAGG